MSLKFAEGTRTHGRLLVWLGALAVALALYAALGLHQWQLPGVNYDEALDAVPAMEVVRGLPLDNEAVVHIAGREWPLMVMPYVGAVSTYLFLPAFALLGPGVLAMRLTTLLIGAASLLAAWGFLREFLDERVASLSTLLLAANPSFVFWTRIGAFVALPVLPLALAVWWCLYRWYCGRGARYLILAAFCLGLGLSTKILFLWLWVALGLGWLVLSPWLYHTVEWRAWLWPWLRARPRALAAAGLAAIVGGGPLLAYNLLYGWPTVGVVLRNLSRTQLYGVNNLDLLGNLRTTFLVDLRAFLDGSWFAHSLGGPFINPVAVPALCLAIVVLACLAYCGKLSYNPRHLALLGLALVAIVFQSAFTITGLGAIHLVILWPIPQALIAASVFALADAASSHWPAVQWLRLGMAGLVGLGLVGAELWTTCRYHGALSRTGGIDDFSDAIYALASDLEQPGTPPAVALDWGFRRSLQVLTQGRVNPAELFEYSSVPGEAMKANIDRRVAGEPALYLFHSANCTSFAGHWEVFEESAYRHRLTPVLWKSYFQRSGAPIYLVYRLEPMPRLSALPPNARRLDVRLGGELGLLGYDIAGDTWHPGDRLGLTLYWQASVRQEISYKVFVHLVDDNGQIVAQRDSVPLNWGYPTTQWEPGEVVADPIRLPLGEQLAPGIYQVFVGMYDEATGQRLPLVQKGQPVPDDRLPLIAIRLCQTE